MRAGHSKLERQERARISGAEVNPDSALFSRRSARVIAIAKPRKRSKVITREPQKFIWGTAAQGPFFRLSRHPHWRNIRQDVRCSLGKWTVAGTIVALSLLVAFSNQRARACPGFGPGCRGLRCKTRCEIMVARHHDRRLHVLVLRTQRQRSRSSRPSTSFGSSTSTTTIPNRMSLNLVIQRAISDAKTIRLPLRSDRKAPAFLKSPPLTASSAT